MRSPAWQRRRESCFHTRTTRLWSFRVTELVARHDGQWGGAARSPHGNKNCSSRSPPAGGSIRSLTTSTFSFHTARAHVRLMVKQSELSLAIGGTHEGAGGRQHSPHQARVDSLPAAVMDWARGLPSAVVPRSDAAEAHAGPRAASARADWLRRQCRAAPPSTGLLLAVRPHAQPSGACDLGRIGRGVRLDARRGAGSAEGRCCHPDPAARCGTAGTSHHYESANRRVGASPPHSAHAAGSDRGQPRAWRDIPAQALRDPWRARVAARSRAAPGRGERVLAHGPRPSGRTRALATAPRYRPPLWTRRECPAG